MDNLSFSTEEESPRLERGCLSSEEPLAGIFPHGRSSLASPRPVASWLPSLLPLQVLWDLASAHLPAASLMDLPLLLELSHGIFFQRYALLSEPSHMLVCSPESLPPPLCS